MVAGRRLRRWRERRMKKGKEGRNQCSAAYSWFNIHAQAQKGLGYGSLRMGKRRKKNDIGMHMNEQERKKDRREHDHSRGMHTNGHRAKEIK
jgi:hypothetical protein